MNENIKIDFAKVDFHIKEFQKVYILEDCSLVFYQPYHLQTRDKKGGELFESEDKKEQHKEQEIIKTKSQEHLEEINKEKEEKISKLGLNADNIDSEFENIKEEDYQKQKEERRKKVEEQRNNRMQESKEQRAEKFKNYDIFYDVYTSKNSKYKSINKKIGFNPDGFKVKNGIAAVKADFFQKCFTKGIYHLIPRLISKQKDEALHFDPVPLEDKGFVVTDFRVGNTKNVKKDLTFQRRIAEIENSNLVLQSPKDFLSALNGGRDFTEYDKKQQAKAIQKGCELKVKEMSKILGVEEKASVKKIKQIIKDTKKEFNRKETAEIQNALGRLDFLKRQKEKVKYYKKIIKKLENPQSTNDGDKPKTIYSKDIGDTGEHVASLLFFQESTRHLSNRRNLDANFNIDGFNHTIPDFLVTLNDYPALVEVKNAKVQSLTEQISFELKLAREYDLDYLFVCNHYTKLLENIAGGNVTPQNQMAIKQEEIEKRKNNKKHETATENLTIFNAECDWGSRKGFIYHRHLHRSIKTAFKEIYLHHIKGAAPNKIMIQRMDLNDSKKLEEVFNKDQNLQKN